MGEVIQLPVRFAGLLSKKELHRAINRSPRWIELKMKEGLPFTRTEDGHARFNLEAVRAWMDERRKVASQ